MCRAVRRAARARAVAVCVTAPIALSTIVFSALLVLSLAPSEVAAQGWREAPPTRAAGGELRVPLRVSELRPPEHPGLRRTYDPVTLGVPLPESAAVFDTDELALDGVSRFQIRPLGTWESGALKWVGVDFMASVEAGGSHADVALVRRDDASGGAPIPPDIARERGDTIDVDTGSMQVRFVRSGTSWIRRVRVGGRPIVADADAFRLVAYDLEGTPYPATVDSVDDVRVVENGPAKAVIRATGSHRSLTGEPLFDFTARFTLFYGNHFVRCEYTLRNASRHSPRHVRHRGVRLEIDTTLGSGGLGEDLRVRMPRHDAPFFVEEGLGAQDEIYHYVAYNHSKHEGASFVRRGVPNEGWVPPIRYDFDRGRYVEQGYRIVKNRLPIVPQSEPGQYNEITYVDVADATGAGVTASIRAGTRLWPVSYDADGRGTIGVGLFSERTTHWHTVRFGTHETREVMLDFRNPEGGGYARAFKESYPLVGRVDDIAWLDGTGVLSDRIVSLDEVNAFLAEAGIEEEVRPLESDYYAVRYYDASQGGGRNQYDLTYHNLVRFFRTGESGPYLTARTWADYRGGQAVVRSDDWTYAPTEPGRFPQFGAENEGEFLVTQGAFFDNQHRHSRGLPLIYYATGLERYREAFLDDVEIVNFNDRIDLRYLNTRVQSVLIRLAMRGVRFLREIEPIVSMQERSGFGPEELHAKTRAYMRAILDARYDLGNACGTPVQEKGWSDEPGRGDNDPRRFWFAGGDREPNREPKFHVFSMFPDALWNYAFFADRDDPNLPEIFDRVLDLEHYFWTYLFAPCPGDPRDASIGPFHVYLFDEDCEVPPATECADGDDFHPAYQLEAFAYRVTGDPVHFDRGIRFMLGQHHRDDQFLGLNAHRTGFLNFVYDWTHRPADRRAPDVFGLGSRMDDGLPRIEWETDEEASGAVLWWSDPADRILVESPERGSAHSFRIQGMNPLRDYTYRAISRDRAGNTTRSEPRYLGFDDFRTDTLDRYSVKRREGSIVDWSGSERAIRFVTSRRAPAVMQIPRRRVDRRGYFDFAFTPDMIGPKVAMAVRLEAGRDDRYEVVVSGGTSEPGEVVLRKIVGGAVVAELRDDRDLYTGNSIRGRVHFTPNGLVFELGSDRIGMQTPEASPIDVSRIRFGVRGLRGRLQHVLTDGRG